jgi:nitrogen regulatory protein PII
MKLLLVVLKSVESLEDVLEGMVEAGVTGATVVESIGMGRILEDVPLFAGLRSMFRSSKPHNNMIFSVIGDEQAAETLQILGTILDCANGRGKGIALTVPIDSAIGMRALP